MTGFIGCGNMGSAIIKGLLGSGVSPEEITASDARAESLENLAKETGICKAANNTEVVRTSDVIILAVKPQFLQEVLKEIKPEISREKLVMSIAAGKNMEFLTAGLGEDKKIIRVMPNTPALVGAGITGFTTNGNVTAEDKERAFKILSSFGEAEEVPEKLMDVVTSLGGSAPAFVYMFIEALADGAVLDGMPRDKAYHFAAQCVLGSAKMVLESGKHPGELKDMVCSPGGTTIEGVRTLEDAGFRGIVMEAVHEATEKSKEL